MNGANRLEPVRRREKFRTLSGLSRQVTFRLRQGCLVLKAKPVLQDAGIRIAVPITLDTVFFPHGSGRPSRFLAQARRRSVFDGPLYRRIKTLEPQTLGVVRNTDLGVVSDLVFQGQRFHRRDPA